MSELDQALVAAQKDGNAKAAFFQKLLSTHFFIPTDVAEGTEASKLDVNAGDAITPLVFEHEGNPYLLLFDSHERMLAWSGQEIAHVELPGYIVAEMTKNDLYWALNVGTEHPFELPPRDIAWLNELVQKNAKQEPQG